MFQNLSNLADLARHAQQARDQVQQIHERLKDQAVEGTAGGGMVKVRANPLQQVLGCQIEPAVLREADREMLEDLIVAATNQALEKGRQAFAAELARTFPAPPGINWHDAMEFLKRLG